MKFKLFLIPVLFLLVPVIVEASVLTDSLQDKIEFWWQGFNGANQVIENVQNNHANMTKAGTGTLPIGRDDAAFPSHNDSTEYFAVATSNTISSYGNFSIEDIKDDTEGAWCFSMNHTLPGGLSGTLVSLSQPDAKRPWCRTTMGCGPPEPEILARWPQLLEKAHPPASPR